MLGNAKMKAQHTEVGGGNGKKIKEGEGKLKVLIFSFYCVDN